MSTAAEKRWFEAVASLEHCVLCQRYGVQVSHSNMLRGMGQKSKPYNTAALCPACHHSIDNAKEFDQLQRREMHMRAIVLTHGKLVEAGKLKLC